MRLGNAAWGFRETPLEQQLAVTAEMELDLLELSIAGYGKDFLQLDATPEQIAEVKALFARYGVSPECAATGCDFTGDDATEQVIRVKKVLDIAHEVGAKYLRIFAGFRSDSEVYGMVFDRMISSLAEVAQYANRYGILPVVETHGGVTVNGGALVHFASVTTRTDYWPAILATGVAINYDPANFAAAGAIDPAGFYELFKEHIAYVHLKDFRDVPGGVAPAACGEGRLDWVRLMNVLKDYNGPALIEYELPEDVADGLKRSLEFLQSDPGSGQVPTI